MKARIAVDFDGTLIEDGHYPLMGPWLPGAVEALRALQRLGEVVIYTCRTATDDWVYAEPRPPAEVTHDLREIERMLEREGLDIEVWTKPYKPPAAVYIDNRAIRFTGNWDVTMQQVLDVLSAPEERWDPSWLGTDYVEGHVLEPGTVIQFDVEAPVRIFETGATRDTDNGKLDFEGFFSPLVLEARAEYMHKHRVMADGSLRESDNWQEGMPLDVYMKSGFRHFFDWWKRHRGYVAREDITTAICALMFNAEGYLHEILKEES